jgi:membrane-bound lytic murein transglycosylase MltF
MMELFSSASPEDRVSLALAAYNAGPARVYDAQDIAAYMSENPQKWTSIQHVLPLLSKRYYSLHERVWQFGKPKNGFFGSGHQTIAYVENVTHTYKLYQSYL